MINPHDLTLIETPRARADHAAAFASVNEQIKALSPQCGAELVPVAYFLSRAKNRVSLLALVAEREEVQAWLDAGGPDQQPFSIFVEAPTGLN